MPAGPDPLPGDQQHPRLPRRLHRAVRQRGHDAGQGGQAQAQALVRLMYMHADEGILWFLNKCIQKRWVILSTSVPCVICITLSVPSVSYDSHEFIPQLSLNNLF